MTQNTEQNVRTRHEQITDLGSRIFVGMRNHTDSMCEAQRHIDEAEARGAEEQRRKDAAAFQDADTVHQNMLRGTIAKPSWDQIKHLYPANVAALEARIVKLKGQITALNTPQYYAAEGDDFCQDSIAAILDECDAERNTIIQVNGYRQVSSEWVFFDGESLHVFPTENEAEAAHTALTREGGV